MEVSNINPPDLGTPPRPTTTPRGNEGGPVQTMKNTAFTSKVSGPPLARTPNQKQKNSKKREIKLCTKREKKTQQHDVEAPGAPTNVNAENESRPTAGHSYSKPNQKRPSDRFHQRNQNQPPPTFLQHPVILEDLKTGSSTFLENGPFKTKLFQTTVGPILP